MTTFIPTLIPITMALTKEEWTARASKYKYRIDVDKISKDKLVEFIQTIIYLYNKQDLTNINLQTVFREQYKGFIVESFKKIRTNIKSKLRKYLLKRNIYVGKNSSRVPIYKLLYEVLQQEEQPEWIDRDIKLTIKELAEPLLIKVLQKRLNLTYDGLATSLLTIAIATVTILPRTQTPTPIIP